ncbi:hypothetical protein GOQ29_14410 [Clostridium sp. D2Q-14]|uniref:hypothetical protein n=1 Tax=Anaeromonas gelatinilytica TaxID=2683194 RepID=UPI00193AFD9A|nr:hypothetical protein [Anaeromonas gelatinilytica]MBS4536810.1 hypothetical protein [Anaeromonas gelatinilytica]
MSIKIKNNFNPMKALVKTRAAIGLYADTEAKRMEGATKRNAPWTDRTSNARNSIRGDFGWQGSKAKIILSGGTEYFPYLELAMEKKYAILAPTLQNNVSKVLKGYQKLVK